MSKNKPKNTLKACKSLPKTKEVEVKQAKSTKVEIIQRVREVQTHLLQGYTRNDILQYGSKWKVSDRQIDDYIAAARKNIKEVSQAGLENDLAIILSAMWETFRRAVSQNNVGEQRQILMAIAKLKGMDETRVNHVIEDKRELSNLSDTELDAILAEEHKH